MPSLSLAVPHSLGQAEAVSRLRTLLAQIKERYSGQVSDLEEQWEGDRLKFGFTTYGFKIQGNVDVGSDQVKLDGQLPIAAMMFKGKIEQAIKDELIKRLA